MVIQAALQDRLRTIRQNTPRTKCRHQTVTDLDKGWAGNASPFGWAASV